MITCHDGTLVSERRGEWKADEHLEEGLRDKDLEQSAVPEAFLLLDLGISRIILTSLNRTSSDAVEETSTPQCHTGENNTLVP
jgi:hypothetical protein